MEAQHQPRRASSDELVVNWKLKCPGDYWPKLNLQVLVLKTVFDVRQ